MGARGDAVVELTGEVLTRQDPVVLTRAAGSNDGLGEALDAAGMAWVEWPALAFEPVEVAEDALLGAKALAFVSPTAVASARTLPWPDVPRIAQGPGTAAALREIGERVDAIADPPDAAGLAEAVMRLVRPGPVALVRGDQGRDVGAGRLVLAGYTVSLVTTYRNVAPPDLARPRQAVRAVVYASPSAVTRHLEANPWLRDAPAVAIGPTTAQALREAGHADVRVAAAPTPAALLAALKEIP